MLSQVKLMQGWIYGRVWKPPHLQLNYFTSLRVLWLHPFLLLDRRPPEGAAGADQREAGPGAADRRAASRGPAGGERPAGSVSQPPDRAAVSPRREPAGEDQSAGSGIPIVPFLLLPRDIKVTQLTCETLTYLHESPAGLLRIMVY